MVDNSIEINRNVPVMSYFSELSKKIPCNGIIEINANDEVSSIAYNLASLTASFYSNVQITFNKEGKEKTFGKDLSKINLRINIHSKNTYDPSIPDELFEDTVIFNNYQEAFKVNSSIVEYWEEIKDETEKRLFKENKELINHPLSKNVSALEVKFFPRINEEISRKRRYWVFERWGPLYKKPPVSDIPKVRLNSSSFYELKKKPEAHYKAYRDCLSLDLMVGNKKLDNLFEDQTEFIKNSIEKGEKNILSLINCNIEKKDTLNVARMNGIYDEYKYMYLKRVLSPFKAIFLRVKERRDNKTLEKVVSKYNKLGEEFSWKKINLEDLNKMINNLRKM